MSIHWPPLPDNIGKTKRIPTIDGCVRHLKIEDEIKQPDKSSGRGLYVFQKMRHIEENQVVFRFGYYMIGVKPRMKGKWVWGQFCPMISGKDFLAVIKEAKKRKWF